MYYIRAENEGDKLRGLPMMLAATAGNEPSAYTAEGTNLFALEELLKPLRSTANRCYWDWSEPYLIYRSNKSSPDELADAGRRYVEHIEAWRRSTIPLERD
jgi:putative NADPH-quinone reductase